MNSINLGLKENEIVVQAQAVKYHDIDYQEGYVVITQNRTRRRIYNGFYFDDTGNHIYVSTYCVGIFQHKTKIRNFIVNTVTKEWREFQHILIVEHKPEKKEPVENSQAFHLRRKIK